MDHRLLIGASLIYRYLRKKGESSFTAPTTPLTPAKPVKSEVPQGAVLWDGKEVLWDGKQIIYS